LQTLMAGDETGDFNSASIFPQVTFWKVGLVSIMNSWGMTQPCLHRLQNIAIVLDPVSTSNVMF